MGLGAPPPRCGTGTLQVQLLGVRLPSSPALFAAGVEPASGRRPLVPASSRSPPAALRGAARRGPPRSVLSALPRRRLGAAAAAVSLALSGAACARGRSQAKTPVTVPLTWNRTGGFCFRYRLGDKGAATVVPAGEVAQGTFLAVADTGSAFLLCARCLRKDCPSYCSRWGCFNGEGKRSGLQDTVEVYVSGESEVEWWRTEALSFPEAIGAESPTFSDVVFGVQGRLRGAGGTGNGVFFGLIRERSEDIRPTFLEQTPFSSFTLDLRQAGSETLTFSPAGLPASRGSVLPLVDPRKWGDPVRHYCAIAKAVRVGGELLEWDEYSPWSGQGDSPPRLRNALCIFDSGTTGATLSRELYRAYFALAREIARTRPGGFTQARRLEFVFDLQNGEELVLDMFMGNHPSYGLGLDIVTPINEVAWAGVGDPESLAGYRDPATGLGANRKRPFDDVVFLGLGFLVGRSLTVDTENGYLTITTRVGPGSKPKMFPQSAAA